MATRDHFRAHARRRVDLGATLLLPPASADAPQGAARGVRIRDLGLGGACVEIVEPGRSRSNGDERGVTAGLDRGASVKLEVTAPSLWDPLVLRGTVVWLRRAPGPRPMRMGIHFEHRDAGALYALFQLLGTQAFEQT